MAPVSYPLNVTGMRTNMQASPPYLVPNPAHDQVQLPDLRGDTRLLLLDAQGRPVRTGQGTHLSLRGLVPGLYLLQATTSGQTARTVRLVIE
jgi:hypothetical protein